jgi:hypothetical protein
LCYGELDHIIQVDYTVHDVAPDAAHEPLNSSWAVGNAERHYFKREKFVVGNECGFASVVRVHRDRPVS